LGDGEVRRTGDGLHGGDTLIGMGDADRTTRLRDEQMHYRDWGWVEQWRAQGERPAWGPGIAMAAFVATLVAVALFVLTSGLADTPWLAISVNLVVAAGMAPALWLSRALPVLRFLAAGAAGGLVLGWLGMLATLPHWS